MKKSKIDFLSALPKDIVAYILSLTSPRDVCRSSAISKEFKSVADSDAVWYRFLRSDHCGILSRKVSPENFSSKKQIYFQLAGRHVLLDGGKLSFALDKASGKKCFMLGARELAIMWGSVPEYWKWISLPQSRFSEVAELVRVCWFSIIGKIEAQLLSPQTTYVAYLVFKLKGPCTGFVSLPLKAHARFVVEIGDGYGDEDEINNVVYLTRQAFGHRRVRDGRLPHKRMDDWKEIELGEFFNGRGDTGELELRLMEIDQLNWKSGIIIEGIELRPKVDSSMTKRSIFKRKMYFRA